MTIIKRLFTLLVLTLASTCIIQAQDDYEKENKAENWYADRCEEVILRFEGLRHDANIHPQRYTIIPYEQASPLGYAMVVTSTDKRDLILYTPNGNGLKAQKVNKNVLPEEIYWRTFRDLGLRRTYSTDITLRERPLPVREVNKAKNFFEVVVDREDAVSDIKAYNQMIFKPHRNSVRLASQRDNKKIDEMGNSILDQVGYTFRLTNPSVTAKMFRGYQDGEICPWVVKSTFFNHHNPLQYTRWKEGEPIKKAGADTRRIISGYYGGRPIKDTQWLATLESGERSFYIVQFEHQNNEALASLVCIAEGEVTSVWEFSADLDPNIYKEGQSIWFVDDEGDFMGHAPEIHCIVATDEGLELYIRMFGGESVQYYVLREMGPIWMSLQVDYWIYVWD